MKTTFEAHCGGSDFLEIMHKSWTQAHQKQNNTQTPKENYRNWKRACEQAKLLNLLKIYVLIMGTVLVAAFIWPEVQHYGSLNLGRTNIAVILGLLGIALIAISKRKAYIFREGKQPKIWNEYKADLDLILQLFPSLLLLGERIMNESSLIKQKINEDLFARRTQIDAKFEIGFHYDGKRETERFLVAHAIALKCGHAREIKHYSPKNKDD